MLLKLMDLKTGAPESLTADRPQEGLDLGGKRNTQETHRKSLLIDLVTYYFFNTCTKIAVCKFYEHQPGWLDKPEKPPKSRNWP